MIAIKTENLTKNYGPIRALNNLNLEVPENVVFGFLGPNGAGKSTTVKLLTGFAHPTSGQAWVAGEKVEALNLNLQKKIGFLPDVPAFYDWMTGREFMHFAGNYFIFRVRKPKNVQMNCWNWWEYQRPAAAELAGIRAACVSAWASPRL